MCETPVVTRPWSVYALSCKGGSLYIGVTNDIERRMKAHANGTGSRFVWAHRPFQLATVIHCESKQAAMSLEYHLKRLKKPKKLIELGLIENKINGGTMTKADIENRVFENVGMPKNEAQEIVEITFNTVKQNLIAGESVKLAGFGTFNVRKKAARVGRNPRTKEEAEIAPRKVVTFRASEILKEVIEKQ